MGARSSTHTLIRSQIIQSNVPGAGGSEVSVTSNTSAAGTGGGSLSTGGSSVEARKLAITKSIGQLLILDDWTKVQRKGRH